MLPITGTLSLFLHVPPGQPAHHQRRAIPNGDLRGHFSYGENGLIKTRRHRDRGRGISRNCDALSAVFHEALKFRHARIQVEN